MSNGSSMDELSGFIGWFLAAVAAAMSTLAATVASLWKLNEAKNTKTLEVQSQKIIVLETSAAKCHEEKAELQITVAKLSTELDFVKRRVDDLQGNAQGDAQPNPRSDNHY